ncbi:MAG: hypothetical protein A3F46_07440 [Legionellales bacterium RIFCSPHIGHO2_12_FULL_42_9]|nr:MAG: hypothetical protein A3F46_07440 [Legionellales bacterium RIFCSPHIGHO2_12_FULL_42_9]
MSEEACIASDEEVFKLKRGLPWEEKVKICERWKQSGLSKVMYCKRHSLVFSTFCSWCDRLWPKGASGQLCQVAVLDTMQKKNMAPPMTIEVSLPNQISAKVSLHEHQVLNLIKELVYAASTPR